MNTNQTEKAYIVLEIASPILVTMLSGEVFESSEYRIGTSFLHCSGTWRGGGMSKQMVLIPLSSIDHVQFASSQVSPDDVPEEHKDSVNLQINKIKPASSVGAARG